MAASTLEKKLRFQECQRALVLNAPEGYLGRLRDLPEGVEISTEPDGEYDFVHLFVKNGAQLDRLRQQALAAATYDCIFWVSYPKRSPKVETDLSRDFFWEAFGDAGLRPVTQISVDDTWSALRFRPKAEVGT
jgi:hypothetical protein